MIHDLLAERAEAGSDGDVQGFVDDVVLLASELCENAVLHAGTAFDLAVVADDDEVTVAVTDRGAGALELHLAEPRQRYGRAATHGRGLSLISRLATTWGTRHDTDGRHTVWFTVARRPGPAAEPADPAPEHERTWSAAEEARWLLHVPASLARRLDPVDLVRELVARLQDTVDAVAVVVEVDRGDGSGARELARAGVLPADPGTSLEVPLPSTTGLQGAIRLVLREGADVARARELTELVAGRIAITAEAQWLREVDQRRQAWTSYLVEASELLGQSLDLDLTVALVPQLVVPRLGTWCAVLLPEPSRQLRLAAIAHADEDRLPELRPVLDPGAVPGPPPQLRARLAAAQGGAAPSWFADPVDGVAVGLRASGVSIGVLLVGRPAGRPHTPEDLMLVDDIARRAALAIHNARTVGEHVRVSQTLQAALLPRALPQVPQFDFAAEYLPASTGADVGGDFYDVVAVAPERWLVTIGDVCGKGARAAARTGVVRDVLRALVREGRPLVQAIEMLNDVMLEAADPQQFCTLAAVMLSRDESDGRPGVAMDLVLAGHAKPVVVRADGTAELIGRFGTALGLLETVDLHCTRHQLAAGETLLLYTDGVTECRRGPEQFDENRLLGAAAAASGRSAARLVAAVREAAQDFATDPPGDDIALLAVRAEPSA
ncbi:serine phosphatase RsbU (regulator of sigma subunit)/anti-sigma regulatory factor (Ser/Thr protein kinase) [Geodermatophilus daqingensis]|uniref:Serine phosphatase RsbU (Regulator of sigma subunit)/anti-sigma regulatory factor (Ser/Thr protein kinase) n=2 Tax=Petropleomorpha daqingensis TaxID=2026353 RepID=A0A853CJX9_9ACTN|nr:serine phosphatase RsbU (regulator of sigma subunit)/anti-sigma regulatory factor (Ser/Thr protein kinase) [Petropleomorpha daqingensis]